MKALALASVLAFSLPASAAADDLKDVRALVEKTVNSVLDILKDKGLEKDARRQKVMALIDPVFDLPLMAKLVLGKEHWKDIKDDEKKKKEYTDLFVETIKDSYYEKIDLFTNETVDFDDPKPAEKGKVHMLTKINSKGKRYSLLYKVYKKGAGWKVYDLEIEGVSLVQIYGKEYDGFLTKKVEGKQNTIDDLIAKMKSKTMEMPQDLKLATKKKADAAQAPANGEAK